ncbi:hypothetical protein QE152_g32016 [Popillia japonica]|uniref:Uncharacterized protein n=1 Tax=Popillia japonica TaxID=7064 RepID=A0AAW1J0B1_POPJA
MLNVIRKAGAHAEEFSTWAGNRNAKLPDPGGVSNLFHGPQCVRRMRTVYRLENATIETDLIVFVGLDAFCFRVYIPYTFSTQCASLQVYVVCTYLAKV